MKFENSETLQRIINAFAGESQAINRYKIFSKIAKNDNYLQISDIFLETAENEREHAKLFYKYVPNGNYKPNDTYPFFSGNTYENLISSSLSEKDEWESIYKNSSEIAKTEGYDEISELFHNIAEIEKRHSHRFSTLAEEIKNENIYKKNEISQWICTKCGHTHIGKEAPCICPVCKHNQKYFKIFTEKF